MHERRIRNAKERVLLIRNRCGCFVDFKIIILLIILAAREPESKDDLLIDTFDL